LGDDQNALDDVKNDLGRNSSMRSLVDRAPIRAAQRTGGCIYPDLAGHCPPIFDHLPCRRIDAYRRGRYGCSWSGSCYKTCTKQEIGCKVEKNDGYNGYYGWCYVYIGQCAKNRHCQSVVKANCNNPNVVHEKGTDNTLCPKEWKGSYCDLETKHSYGCAFRLDSFKQKCWRSCNPQQGYDLHCPSEDWCWVNAGRCHHNKGCLVGTKLPCMELKRKD